MSTTKQEQFNYYQAKNTPATKIVLTFSLIQKESDPPRQRKTKQQQTNKQTKNCVLNKVAPAKQKRSPGFVWKEVVQKILAVKNRSVLGEAGNILRCQ